jgi:predicted dehydrogenase/acetyltransferase-like isoleucine patch superfamily enzyme
VIGCGYWGSKLVERFAQLGVLAAVCDDDPIMAERAAAATGATPLQWDAVLADPTIQAVAIATPPASHAEIAVQALEAGKHAFVEKPLALRVADAEQVVKAADAAGKIVMVGHLLRYHPAFTALEAMVSEGRLGKLRYIYSNRLNFGRFRKVENILWSFSPHDLSMILRLVGAEPTEVHAIGEAYLQPGVSDVTTTHLSFPGGEAAHVFVSWLHPFKEQKLVVVGEAGMAVFDDGEPWGSKLRLSAHEVSWKSGVPQASKIDSQIIPLQEREPLLEECRHFVACITNGTTPLTDGEEAIRVLRILERAENSMRASHQASAASDAQSERNIEGGTMIHPTAVIDPGVEIGERTKVWHFSHVLKGSKIGADCTLGQNVMVGPDVTVGNNCKIQNNVSVYKGVHLEDDVFCGPSVVFTNVKTPRSQIDRKDAFLATMVRKGATIGANATIVCGNEIGAFSMVGAAAVVVRPVAPHALVVGNPAERIGWVSHHGEVLGSDLVCPVSSRRYEEKDGELFEVVP